MIIVTGGAGFIGSNFVLEWLRSSDEPILVLDALTYAGNRANLQTVDADPRFEFVHGDVNDRALLDALIRRTAPRAVLHFAAESHVDRSILGPAAFMRTNVEGTFCLLEACRAWWHTLPEGQRADFRFIHVSTDEVYGTLGPDDPPFSETTAYAPNSPYAASKAGSDHLARAWFHTYGLPTLITNCSNNYGPMQFPEKLIPLMISNALACKPLPVYGDGRQIRDWLHVSDHCAALRAVLARGVPGEAYNIGGRAEKPNIEVVHTICGLLDARRPDPAGPRTRLITHVTDRPGHDRRYAIDSRKIARELGWQPAHSFETGLAQTIDWYLSHAAWIESVQSGAYRDWIATQYGARPPAPAVSGASR
jgi:dTDP-glucose 4,6-dehydratase